MNYLQDAYYILRDQTRKIHKSLHEVHELEEKIDSGGCSVERQKELVSEHDSLKSRIYDTDIPAALAAGAEPFNREIKRLEDLDKLNGSDITDDARLLSSGIKLRMADIESILEKPENDNPTMRRLISDYCERNKIMDPDTGSRYRVPVFSHRDDIKKLQSERDSVIKYFGRWIDKPKAFEFLEMTLLEIDKERNEA